MADADQARLPRRFTRRRAIVGPIHILGEYEGGRSQRCLRCGEHLRLEFRHGRYQGFSKGTRVFPSRPILSPDFVWAPLPRNMLLSSSERLTMCPIPGDDSASLLAGRELPRRFSRWISLSVFLLFSGLILMTLDAVGVIGGRSGLSLPFFLGAVLLVAAFSHYRFVTNWR